MTDSKSDAAKTDTNDYAGTLYLPKTDFPMRGGLPQKEPEILAHWAKIDLYGKLRAGARGRDKFVLHDGPPYANGNIHIGHALNKILKDLVTRSQQMLGKDSNYVPGWDCHGLPIEWKIEEEYRAKGQNKDAVPVVEFRQQCRAFAQKWVDIQREEFKRLGITGDWAHPYLTMSFAAEAQIAREIMKFSANGLLYRGSKPVMWSVVEKTALAEAEVEYEDYVSDTVFVAFPWSGGLSGKNIGGGGPTDFLSARVVIWTTTPWTIPGNRAIAYSPTVSYGLYRVTLVAQGHWVKQGDEFILADKLAEGFFAAGRVEAHERLRDVPQTVLHGAKVRHPLSAVSDAYNFDVPLFVGDYVTDDTGTGFVHMAPGHGREDFDLWMANGQNLMARGIDTRIPFMVDADGFYTDEAPGFGPSSTEGHPGRVITDKGEKGNANQMVMDALVKAGHLVARGRLKHQYPHSWRSKKPIIFRNTPQWFIAMDKVYHAASGADEKSLRDVALAAITQTRWVPASGQNRITGMITNRPDWVVSRQRAWGVPIAVFVDAQGEILRDEAVNARIAAAFEEEGADAWFAPGAAARFLGLRPDAADWSQVKDVLDVWFDSGSTHAFVLEDQMHFPALAEIRRKVRGGRDEVMYLEGTDQHRGWFHSSLLESCGTRGHAPFDVVLTHGFTLDEQGRKMSKSLGNTVVPQKIIEQSGADILRLWVASVDYSDDQRIGPDILKSVSDTYRKLRNTLRWMLGTLAHYQPQETPGSQGMSEIERLMLHRLAELDGTVRAAFAAFDYNKVLTSVTAFMVADLSAFYFDVRKDALYCDAPSSPKRHGALEAISQIFRCVTLWLAPILVFTCEEAWRHAHPEALSVHLETFPDLPESWRDEELATKWSAIRKARGVVTGALEIARANKELGSSLEASPEVYIADAALLAVLNSVDFAEVCITSDVKLTLGEGPGAAFRLADMPGVAVVTRRASGIKCARSWRRFDPATALPGFPDVTPRDALALQELVALRGIMP